MCRSTGETGTPRIRFRGSLGLLDEPTSSLVMQYEYTHWFRDLAYGRQLARSTRTQPNQPFQGKFLLLEGVVSEKSYAFLWKTYDVFRWGENLVFDPSSMILVDAALDRAYPRLLEQS